MITIDKNKCKSIIQAIADGEMFAIGYYRKEPVCMDCRCNKGIREGVCPECGSSNIEYTNFSVAQKGVFNPKNAKKPNGKGQSAETAEKLHNNLKYFAPAVGDENGRGVYRSCGYARIFRLTTKGVTYDVYDADDTLI